MAPMLDSEQRQDLKRRQNFEDSPILDGSRQFKRPHLTQLPIRASMTTPQDNSWQSLAPNFHHPLTPVDSSDDESHGQAETAWVHKRLATSAKQLFNHKLASTIGSPDLMDDDMDMGPPAPVSIQRSSSPYYQTHLIAAPTYSLDERIPTPITTIFNLSEDTPKQRNRQTKRHTSLSPVRSPEMGNDPYLPHPGDSDEMAMDTDPETTIRMEHASHGFGALSVACNADDVMEDAVHIQERPRAANSRSGRNAKLHMGYRADCEKCQQRVPGHYSHIIWS